MANRLNVLVGAVLDSSVTKNLNKELAELELRDVAVNLTLSKKTLTSFQNAISKAAQEIFDSISLSDDAIKKMGQNIGKGIAKGFEESGESATKYFKEIEKQSSKTTNKVIENTEKIAEAQKKQYKISARRVSDVTSVKSVWKNIETKVPYASLKPQNIGYDKLDLSALSENARKDIEEIQKELLEVEKEKKQISDEIDKLEDDLAKRLKLKRTVKLKDASGHISHEEMMENINKTNDLNDSLGPLDKKIWDLSARQDQLLRQNAESILVTQEKRVKSSAKLTKAKKEEASIVEEISEKEIESANKQIAAQEAVDNSVKSADKNAKRFIDAEEQKQHALKQTEEVVEDAENAVKSFQKVYDDAGDLAKESVKYDFKDGHTAKVETFYNLDEDGNVTPSKRVTLDNKEEEFAYKNVKNKSIALENLEEKRQKTLLKTVTVANEVEKSLRKIYDNSSVYDNSIYGYDQDRQLQSFEAELDDIYKILSKDNVQLYEIIEAANRLNNLKIDSDKFGLDLSNSHSDYIKQIESRKEADKKAADDYVRFWEKAAVDLRQKEIKTNDATREKQLAAEEKEYRQRLKWNSKELEEKVKAQDKSKQAYSETYDLLQNTQKESRKYDSDIYNDKAQKQVDSYKKKILGLTYIINDEKSSIEEVARATERLVKLQKSVEGFGQKLANSQANKTWYHNQLSEWNKQTDREVTRLKSQYGTAFNEAEYRKMRDLESEVLKIIKQQGYSKEAIIAIQKKLNSNTRTFTTNLAASKKEIKEIEDHARVLNSSLGRFVQFYSFGELFRTIKTGAIEIATAIKDVDSSMVELRKVTDETEYAYDRFFTNSAKRAKDLGVTLTDYIDSVTNFARMDVGGFEAAQTVAQSANIMQQVAEDLSADQASEYLISIMKSFNIEANETISIVDTLNNLSNNFAITTDGLGASLVRSAAAMRAANNTLEETAALTIAANNVLQNPETVGNALKTVSINYLVA